MLIGIDASRSVIGQRTGTEAYARFLIRQLIPLAARRGHQLRLYFNQPPAHGLFPAPYEPVVIPFPRLWSHLRLAWELQRNPPDIFFTPAHVIPFTYHRRSVATVHDLGYHHFPEAHTWRQLAYLRWSTRHNGRVSYRIIADSRATRSDLVRFDALTAAKIEVVYPGIDPTLQPVTEESHLAAVQRKYQIRSPYLLYIGTLQPRKNLVRLIRAFVTSHLPHQLVLAGKSGWLSQPILDEVKRQQAPIILPGFVPDADKAALISGATALLYPSLYEGFGFPALEAQACATPLLCANTSSLPEIVGDGALLVDPLNEAGLTQAIVQIASDANLRQTLVQKGQQNVKRFTWERTASQVLAVLEQAAA